MRVALGPGVVLAHILQGLFHPARKVREVYWHVVRRPFPTSFGQGLRRAELTSLCLVDEQYNSLYMGAQDALVAFYPTLEGLSDERNVYERDSLMMWI